MVKMKTIFIFLSAFIFFTLSNCGQPTTAQKPVGDSVDTTPKSKISKIALTPLQITFASGDGLIITADSYFQHDTLPWILLCHQAGYSRGEYKETAVKFEKLGYNCLAIDQRSGDSVNGVKNETAARAKEQGKPTDYLDAEQDIVAAINYLFQNSQKPVILVGSSYSAGLVLKIAVGNPKVKAVLSFSPGEYYGNKLQLAKSITKINVPVFITCAKSEVKSARTIFDAIESKNKLFFSPSSPGIHASSALWESTNDYKEYWKAVETFFSLL
jgi:dienelactone hydrolase